MKKRSAGEIPALRHVTCEITAICVLNCAEEIRITSILHWSAVCLDYPDKLEEKVTQFGEI